MKTVVFFFILALLLCSAKNTQAQFIKGEVLDYITDQPVPFAHVYFNSSMRGTTTDQNGHFHILTKDFEGQYIVVSCVGYDTWILKEWEEGTTYRVYLKPSSNVLPELYITSGKRKRNSDKQEQQNIRKLNMPRKRNEKKFLQEFLGTTENGLNCWIENLEDVQLVYEKKTKTLKGFCDKPMIIYNKSLGYKIRYYLDSFKLNREHMFYEGYYMFEDDTTLTRSELEMALKRRRIAYDGSRMHFFREMWRKSTYKLKFQVQYAGSPDLVSLDSLIGDIHNHVRLMKPLSDLDVYYKNNFTRVSFVGDKGVPFARIGFYNSHYVRWQGKMAEQRVGDLLPFEYWP